MTQRDHTPLTPAIEDRVVELYRSGAKTQAITEETGVARPTIYWILNKRGITPTRAKRATGEINVSNVLEQLSAAEREIGKLMAELAAKEAAIAELLSQLAKQNR